MLRQGGAQVRVPVHGRVVRVAHVQVRVAAKEKRTSPLKGGTSENGGGSGRRQMTVIAIGPRQW